jgi:hypothetical protein
MNVYYYYYYYSIPKLLPYHPLSRTLEIRICKSIISPFVPMNVKRCILRRGGNNNQGINIEFCGVISWEMSNWKTDI